MLFHLETYIASHNYKESLKFSILIQVRSTRRCKMINLTKNVNQILLLQFPFIFYYSKLNFCTGCSKIFFRCFGR